MFHLVRILNSKPALDVNFETKGKLKNVGQPHYPRVLTRESQAFFKLTTSAYKLSEWSRPTLKNHVQKRNNKPGIIYLNSRRFFSKRKTPADESLIVDPGLCFAGRMILTAANKSLHIKRFDQTEREKRKKTKTVLGGSPVREVDR